MNEFPGGVWPAMFSPLTEDDRPNLPMIDKLIDHYLAEQLDGVYILGSTGQGPALTLDMRRSITEHTVKAVAGRMPVIVQVGTGSTIDSIHLAKHAADVGADGISSVPPIYFPASPEVELEHYRQIASATNLPFLPYYIYFGEPPMPIVDYIKRVLEIPNICGIKMTTRDMFTIGLAHNASEGKLRLYSGADELICHATLSGAHGAIGTWYTLWGAACRKMRQASIDGQFEATRHFVQVFQHVVNHVLSSNRFYRFVRKATQLQHDIDIGPGRAPMCSAGQDWDESEVRRLVDEVNAAAGLK